MWSCWLAVCFFLFLFSCFVLKSLGKAIQNQLFKDLSGGGVSQLVQKDQELVPGREGPLSPQRGGDRAAPGTETPTAPGCTRTGVSASALQVSARGAGIQQGGWVRANRPRPPGERNPHFPPSASRLFSPVLPPASPRHPVFLIYSEKLPPS